MDSRGSDNRQSSIVNPPIDNRQLANLQSAVCNRQ
jgi:hypothetical protein